MDVSTLAVNCIRPLLVAGIFTITAVAGASAHGSASGDALRSETKAMAVPAMVLAQATTDITTGGNNTNIGIGKGSTAGASPNGTTTNGGNNGNTGNGSGSTAGAAPNGRTTTNGSNASPASGPVHSNSTNTRQEQEEEDSLTGL
jgi:hypothetical protein